MNILFINTTFRIFDGIDSGAANRSTMFVRALARLGHVDVISFYKEPLTSNVENCDVVFSGEVEYKEPTRTFLEKLWYRIKRVVAILNPYTYYELNTEQEAVVDSFYRGKEYDIVACRYIWNAISCGLLKYSDKLVVDVDDNPSSEAKRELLVIEYKFPWSKLTYWFRANTIGMMARHLLKGVLCSFYSNKFAPPYKGSTYLHNVTNCERALENVSDSTPDRLLIVGWMDYWPNKIGVMHFAENVFPKVRSLIPNAELHIVGKTSDNEFQNKLNAISGVSVLGYVDEIEDEYRNARMCVVPVYHGSGTSVKFIEALSIGRAVISTPLGVRGFEDVCESGRDYILARTDDIFVKEITSHITDIDGLNRMAANGHQISSEYFSRDKFSQIVVDGIRNAIQ